MGPWCKEGKEWLNQLGQNVIIGDIKVKNVLNQISTIKVQRGNSCLCCALTNVKKYFGFYYIYIHTHTDIFCLPLNIIFNSKLVEWLYDSYFLKHK